MGAPANQPIPSPEYFLVLFTKRVHSSNGVLSDEAKLFLFELFEHSIASVKAESTKKNLDESEILEEIVPALYRLAEQTIADASSRVVELDVIRSALAKLCPLFPIC